MSRSNSARPISGACCPRSPRAMDDPAADYAILPTYKLAAAAREAGLKVILSGEGGDELFAGYGRYRSVDAAVVGGRHACCAGAAISTGSASCAAISPAGATASRRPSCSARRPGRTRLQVAQATDCADWLPNDLLTKLDRCLMAHGVEGRTPFLDPVRRRFRLPPARRAEGAEGARQVAAAALARRACAGGRAVRQEARLHRAGRRMDRAARRAAGRAGRGAAGRARDLPARRGRDALPRADEAAPGLRRLDACCSMRSGTAATSSACPPNQTCSPRWGRAADP